MVRIQANGQGRQNLNIVGIQAKGQDRQPTITGSSNEQMSGRGNVLYSIRSRGDCPFI